MLSMHHPLRGWQCNACPQVITIASGSDRGVLAVLWARVICSPRRPAAFFAVTSSTALTSAMHWLLLRCVYLPQAKPFWARPWGAAPTFFVFPTSRSSTALLLLPQLSKFLIFRCSASDLPRLVFYTFFIVKASPWMSNSSFSCSRACCSVRCLLHPPSVINIGQPTPSVSSQLHLRSTRTTTTHPPPSTPSSKFCAGTPSLNFANWLPSRRGSL